MGLYPKIQAYDGGLEVVDVFRGLNRSEKISEGEWSEELNLTSDRFPMLSVRRGRKIVERFSGQQIVTLLAKDDLYVLNRIGGGEEDAEDTAVLLKGTTDPVEVARFTYPKSSKLPGNVVSFGAYIVMPDINAWYNTADGTSGTIDASFSVSLSGSEEWTFTVYPVDDYGEKLTINEEMTSSEGAIQEAENPQTYADGECYANTDTMQIRQFKNGYWRTVNAGLRIEGDGINAGFEAGDVVEMKDWGATANFSVDESNWASSLSALLSSFALTALELNGYQTIAAAGTDYIVLKNKTIFATSQTFTFTAENLGTHVPTVERVMPDMDIVIQAQNRLWGCKYGDVDGEMVNEIYASALGDFKNWRKYDGTSMASYAASVGTDGEWTGAVSFQGKPHFFKDKHVHKVYISATGAHQIVDNSLLGVQEGCSKSLCVLDGALYYMSHDGVCVYDGSTPKVISEELGRIDTRYACFGGAENKLWTFFWDYSTLELYVYDVKRGIWHQENCGAFLPIRAFARLHDSLYTNQNSMLIDLLGHGDGENETTVSYSCTSGLIGWQNIEQKYISRFDLRLTLPQGATMKVEIEYDSSGTWEEQGTVSGGGTGSVVIPVRPRRCDHFRLRLSGTGEMRMYSWAKRLTKGSDVVL